ncbi:MAG: C_GCAxxG_C_C family protein [Anaerolineae bacterium]|nr:C_GCAxxG_C_C family protein [Anaerolineae bacterium]
MVDKVVHQSGAFFKSGYYCAESILLAVAEWKGIESDLIPRIATGFCSGMARSCGLCGAVSGAVMGISLVAGRDSPDEPVVECYTLVQQFLDEFEARFGSTNCQQLIGCDLNTEQGQADFKANHLIEQCTEYVQEAMRMVAALV